MAFFHEYPYDSAHELNLDWIIKTVKLVNEKIDNVIDSYGQPVIAYQKALMNDPSKIYLYEGVEPDMNSGHWYYFNELTSEWVDGGIYGGTYVTNNYTNIFEPSPAGGSIIPVYLGDTIFPSGCAPASCIKVGNTVYMLASYNNTANTGILRAFDIESNAQIGTDQTIVMGHGNSVAHDPEDDSFWVVPIWNRSSGTAVGWPVIIKYDSTWSSYITIPTPTTGKSVSYDSVSGIMYYQDYNGDVYAYINTVWEYKYHVRMPAGSTLADYIQDFAVRDGHFYMTTPKGYLAEGFFPVDGTDVANIVSVRNIYYGDFANRWILGEIQGMEFDADGHLLAANATTINHYYDGFFLELPVSNMTPYGWATYMTDWLPYDMTISPTTQAKFYLGKNEIRSFSQLTIERDQRTISMIIVDGLVEETQQIVITQDLTIRLTGTSDFRPASFMIQKGMLTLDVSANTTITFTGVPFTLNQGGQLQFQGAGTLTIVQTTSQTVAFYNKSPMIYIHRVPSVASGFKINSTTVSAVGAYFGASKL